MPDARPEQRRDRRMFAPVADSDYMAFVEALMRRDRNRHARAGRGNCFFSIDPPAAAVVIEPAIMTGWCMPPWRSPWHRTSPGHGGRRSVETARDAHRHTRRGSSTRTTCRTLRDVRDLCAARAPLNSLLLFCRLFNDALLRSLLLGSLLPGDLLGGLLLSHSLLRGGSSGQDHSPFLTCAWVCIHPQLT